MLKPNIYVASVIVSLSGFLFGYDAGAIGPMTEMPYFFHLSPGPRGLVVASLLLAVFPISIILAGSLANRYGRVPTMAAGGILGLVGNIICTTSFSVGQSCGVWQAESSPTAIRGRIGAMAQTFIPSGAAVGFFASYGTVRINSSASWRIISAIPGAVTLIMTVLLLTPLVPESPRWLLLKGHPSQVLEAERLVRAYARSPQEGEDGWRMLAGDVKEEQAARMRIVSTSGGAIGSVADGSRFWSNLGMDRRNRKRSIVSILLASMVALSGVDALLWYAPLVFARAGLESQASSFMASGLLTGGLVVVTILSHTYLIDRFPRRLSLGIGGLGMAVPLFVLGILAARGGQHPSAAVKWTSVALFAIYFFLQVIPHLLLGGGADIRSCQVFFVAQAIVVSAEILPTEIRSTVTALGRAGLTLLNILLLAGMPKWAEISLVSVYFNLGGLNLITIVLAIFFIPETLHVPLERITLAAMDNQPVAYALPSATSVDPPDSEKEAKGTGI